MKPLKEQLEEIPVYYHGSNACLSENEEEKIVYLVDVEKAITEYHKKVYAELEKKANGINPFSKARVQSTYRDAISDLKTLLEIK